MLRFLVDDQRPLCRQHRKRIASPLLPRRTDLMRLGQRCQVSDRPGDDVSIAVQKPVPFGARAQNARDVARNGGFLRENSNVGMGHRHAIMITVQGLRNHPTEKCDSSTSFDGKDHIDSA
jgi:hypothetical protein